MRFLGITHRSKLVLSLACCNKFSRFLLLRRATADKMQLTTQKNTGLESARADRMSLTETKKVELPLREFNLET